MPLGVTLSAEPNKERQTEKQRNGLHLLLTWWLEADPTIARDLEDLKTKMLKAKFGAAKVTDEHGNEAFIPVRRTTREWSWELPGYKRKLLSRALYIDLIEFVYDMAAQEGVMLPNLEPDVMKRRAAR